LVSGFASLEAGQTKTRKYRQAMRDVKENCAEEHLGPKE
jgi:hypothetical protein